MANIKSLILIFLLIIYLVDLSHSTLGPSDKKTKKKKSQVIEQQEIDDKPADKSVVERGLVQSTVNSRDIFFNHMKYCEPCSNKKVFTNTVLGYVTPWNSLGYSIAKHFSSKFNYVSPVWLTIQRLGLKQYELSGTKAIDKGWMADVKKNSAISFVPRIMLEKFTAEDHHALFNDEDEMTALVEMLVDSAKKNKFGGYVLEIYSQLHGFSKMHIAHLITDLAKALHASKNKKLILVIPPAFKHEDPSKNVIEDIVFNKDDFKALQDVVDGFSLMTYDYASSIQQIAPNSPYNWIRMNVEYLTDEPNYRAKILLGLNFYGVKYTIELLKQKKENAVEPLTGVGLIELLKSYRSEIIYDDKSIEHVLYLINQGDKNKKIDASNTNSIIYYPTLFSIQKRIELAQELGVGISIWELGQGLDYFYDLL